MPPTTSASARVGTGVLVSQNLSVHHRRMARTSTASSTEVLAGLVDRVTFHNSDNGFCVLRVKARGQRDLITLVGHAAMISAGEFVQESGSWISDRTHGVQFRASFLKTISRCSAQRTGPASALARSISSFRKS